MVKVKRPMKNAPSLHVVWKSKQCVWKSEMEIEWLANNNIAIQIVSSFWCNCFAFSIVLCVCVCVTKESTEQYIWKKKVKQDQKKWALTGGVESLSHSIIVFT